MLEFGLSQVLTCDKDNSLLMHQRSGHFDMETKQIQFLDSVAKRIHSSMETDLTMARHSLKIPSLTTPSLNLPHPESNDEEEFPSVTESLTE